MVTPEFHALFRTGYRLCLKLPQAALVLAAAIQAGAHPDEILVHYEKSQPAETDKTLGRPQWEIGPRVPFVGSPVHEKMTVEAINLSGVHGRAYRLDYDEAYIKGVFWNDDPDSLLCPECSALNLREFDRRWGLDFALRFTQAKKRAQGADGKPPYFFSGADGLLERSHYGDLQFLHGMATRDGELAVETQRKILLWAEFTYKVATGIIDQRTAVKQVPLVGIRELFAANAEVSNQPIERLFRGRIHAKRVAIGSLLHLIQDSYASGHTDRVVKGLSPPGEPEIFSRGAVREFHSYTNQDSAKHAEDDAWPRDLKGWSAGTDDNPVSVGARILQFMYADEGEGAPWAEVEAYLRDVVFTLTADATPASAGAKYHREPSAGGSTSP